MRRGSVRATGNSNSGGGGGRGSRGGGEGGRGEGGEGGGGDRGSSGRGSDGGRGSNGGRCSGGGDSVSIAMKPSLSTLRMDRQISSIILNQMQLGFSIMQLANCKRNFRCGCDERGK
ncbi:Hypothetical predicted protein [Octopus vulgaris]|uniref:Uncharacterized protein n=1 Tax=Octopus vulgaris TaxID=6645 RepID=A0AA36ASJ1_OCTVU|nr:Hypothetical predicted protein [Octopus vulgaris]